MQLETKETLHVCYKHLGCWSREENKIPKNVKNVKKVLSWNLQKKKRKIYTVQFRIGGKFGESLSGKADKIFEKQDL